MPANPPPQLLGDAFSYHCHGCGRCCRNKLIQLNPFEVAAIARHLDVSAVLVKLNYLDETGTYIKHREDNCCTFFRDNTCTIHPVRPLVCRLYPLGIERQVDGKFKVLEHPPHPDTEGVYGTDGTVCDWIKDQKAEDYLKAAEAYHALFVDLAEAVNNGMEADIDVDILMDLDRTVKSHCQAMGKSEPIDDCSRYRLHIEAIRTQCGLRS